MDYDDKAMVSQKAKVKNLRQRRIRLWRKKFNLLIPLVVYLASSGMLGISQAHAVSASSDHFQLELEPYEEPAVELTPTPTAPPEPVQPQTGPGIAFVPSPFTFSISEPFIDFGLLTATNPVIRTHTMSIASPGTGYQVFVFESNPLRSKSKANIPDTTCDNGSCSEITASLWENNLTYGFGFRCDSELKFLCTEDFATDNMYKQLPDHSKSEIIQPIIQSSTRTNEHQARITYKINISGAQQKQSYSNTVTYIAVPNY